MSPIAWAIRPLKRYAEFSGRSSRAEFWWFFLFMMIIYFVIWIAFAGAVGSSMSSGEGGVPSTGMLGALGAGVIFIGLFWLAIIIPSIAVQMRRIHDLDRSGWWLGGYYLLYALYLFMTLGTLFSAAAAGNADPSQMWLGGMIGTMIVGLAFFIYSIILLVFFCTRGTKGPNRFGPDPYGEDVSTIFA